ncbi:hypothetical protein AAKU55_001172 [Oxalobacteraceae bacterium GrIS 1.11]
MSIVDLSGRVTPGHGAAGLVLGQHFQDIRGALGAVEPWQARGRGLVETIACTDGWLQVDASPLAGPGVNGKILCFKCGALVLHFSAQGDILCGIDVYSGYGGAVFSDVRVGDPMAAALRHCALAYDGADAMYYPLGHAARGIAFCVGETGASDLARREIVGMSVHRRDLARA